MMPKRWASSVLAHPISVAVPCGSAFGALTQDLVICSQLALTWSSEGIFSCGKGACCYHHHFFVAFVLSMPPPACAHLACVAAVHTGLLSCRSAAVLKCSVGFSFFFFFSLATNKQILNIWSADCMAQGLRMIKSRSHTETSRNDCF